MNMPVSEQEVRDLYKSILGRDADAGGLQAQMGAGIDANQLRQNLLGSQEFKSGVANLYPTLLGRQADTGGLAAQQGSGLGIGDIQHNMQTSPEFYTRQGAVNLLSSLTGATPQQVQGSGDFSSLYGSAQGNGSPSRFLQLLGLGGGPQQQNQFGGAQLGQQQSTMPFQTGWGAMPSWGFPMQQQQQVQQQPAQSNAGLQDWLTNALKGSQSGFNQRLSQRQPRTNASPFGMGQKSWYGAAPTVGYGPGPNYNSGLFGSY
jgi:hypothetical protein